MSATSAGMAEYQDDLREYPTYASGEKRPAWEELSDMERSEWELYARNKARRLAVLRGDQM